LCKCSKRHSSSALADIYRTYASHELLTLAGYFSPRRAKNNLQKKESTGAITQAKIAFA
jgi:hypothetical protein